jgi:hypothetical protein
LAKESLPPLDAVPAVGDEPQAPSSSSAVKNAGSAVSRARIGFSRRAVS